MGYHLGVDLGTTFVAAALATDSRVEMVTLGDRVSGVLFAVQLQGERGARAEEVLEAKHVAREVERQFVDETFPIL
ncbi:hypothetical protein B4Q13_24095 [Lacticaseibacillus rhamnosus]